MSNKSKGIACIIMAMLSAFTYGGYTYATIRGLATIETYRWIMTGLFGLWWCVLAVKFLSDKD